MATVAVFSGENSSINIISGTSSVNVEQELYSAWKVWTQQNDNMRWLHAFRTVGGDPTASGQFAPKYFFLMNGWRIYVDGNLTPYVDFALNLYVDEGGSPFVLSNNATVSNLRSDVAVVESEIANILAYDGILVYDEIDGVSGTTYPTGTRYQPVNNPTDLKQLQTDLDITEVLLRSDMNCITGVSFFNTLFRSKTAAVWIYFVGQEDGFHGCYFSTLRLNGDVGHSEIVVKDCALANLDNMAGIADNCHFMGNIHIASGHNLNTSHCVSGIPGNESPSVDMNAGHTTTLSVRDYSGGLKIYNCDTSGDTATLEYVAGKAHLLSGNTDGLISVRGVVSLNDQTSGTTVDTSAMYDTSNEYDGVLHFSDGGFDSVSGTSYPVGTSRAPVDNWSDAVEIMEKYHLHDVLLHTSTTLTEPLVGKNIGSTAGVVQINVNGQRVDTSMFKEVHIYGDFADSYQCVLQNCFTNTMLNFNGVMKDCAIEGNIGLSVSGETSILDCAGGDANEIITIDKLAGQATSLNVRRYAGGLTILNSDQPTDKCGLLMEGGKVTIDSSCTDGIFGIAGTADLVNSGGTGVTINSESLIEPNEWNSYFKEILGLSQSNFVMANQVYDVNNNMTSANVYTYLTAADANADTNRLFEYTVTATYDGDNNVSSYIVVKN